MKLKFGERLIEPEIRRLYDLRDVAFDSSGTLRSVTFAAILSDVPPERTNVPFRVGVQGRGDLARTAH